MTEKRMAWHIANHYGVRTNLCVPNLSWGMGFWEMDLAVVTKSGYLHEIEIKVSVADFRADKKKGRWSNPADMRRFDEMVSQFFYAVPVGIAEKIDPSELPNFAGLFVVNPDSPHSSGIVSQIKPSLKSKGRKLDEKEMFQLARLGGLRYWSECRRNFKTETK